MEEESKDLTETKQVTNDAAEIEFLERFINGEIHFALPPSVEYAEKRLKKLESK